MRELLLTLLVCALLSRQLRHSHERERTQAKTPIAPMLPPKQQRDAHGRFSSK